MAREKTVKAQDFQVMLASAADIAVLSVTPAVIDASTNVSVVNPGVAMLSSDTAGVSGFIIGVSGTGLDFSYPTITTPLSFYVTDLPQGGYTTVPVTAMRLDSFSACTTAEISSVMTFRLSGGDIDATRFKTTTIIMSTANVPVGSRPCGATQCRHRLLGYI